MFNGRNLTPTQIKSFEQSKAFRSRIAEQASKLQARKLRDAIGDVGVEEELELEARPHCFVVPGEGQIWRVQDLQNLVCATAGLTYAELLASRRSRRDVLARQVAMYLCRLYTSKSFPDLGKRFGGRDHSTVLHAANRMAALDNSPKGTTCGFWSADDCDRARSLLAACRSVIDGGALVQ